MIIENLLPIVKDIGLSAAVDRICMIIIALLFIAAPYVLFYIRYRYEKKIERLDSRLYFYIDQYHDLKIQLSALKKENSYLFEDGYVVLNLHQLYDDLGILYDEFDAGTGEFVDPLILFLQNEDNRKFYDALKSNIVHVHLQEGDDDTC